MLAILPACPDLRGIYLDGPAASVVKHLHMFKHISGLKLSKANCGELHGALERLSGLASIELVNAREALDLTVVAKCCPKLESLQIYYSRSVQVY